MSNKNDNKIDNDDNKILLTVNPSDNLDNNN